MTEHPYWSYGPGTGQPIVDALAEGRRQAALELAGQTTSFDLNGADPDRTDAVLENAAKIEAFLKGDASDDDLEYLRGRSRKLRKLEAAGVDNWEGYSRALEGSDGGE